eukprot:sb/3460966/
MFQITSDFGVIHLKRTPKVSHLFAPLLFSLTIDQDGKLEYDIRLEAARLLNETLDVQGAEFHKFLSTHSEIKGTWLQLGECVLTAGDMELQTSLVELTCRLFGVAKRAKYASKLFKQRELSELLTKISDAQFEKDCRVFLNVLNSTVEKRMVYSFKCERVYTPKGELKIPEHQQWLDINFGSQSLSIYVNSGEDDGEYETLQVRPVDITKHEHAFQSGHFHLALQLKVPVSALLDSVKGDCKSLHFVLAADPDPKGPILGLIGPHQVNLSSQDERKGSRCDVSLECISIKDMKSSVVSRPVKPEGSQPIPPSQPSRPSSQSGTRPSSQSGSRSQVVEDTLAQSQDEIVEETLPQALRVLLRQLLWNGVGVLLQETLPTEDLTTAGAVPETQRVPDSCPQSEWMSSSFDYTKPQLDDSGLELNDTIQDMMPCVEEGDQMKGDKVDMEKEVAKLKDELKMKEENKIEKIKQEKIKSRREVVKAEVKKEKKGSPARKTRGRKKSLEFAENPVIRVGGDKVKTPEEKLTITNNPKGKKKKKPAVSLESSPDLEMINHEIAALSSPALPQQEKSPEPPLEKDRSFKRKLMNAEDEFLSSLPSPFSQRDRDVKKLMNSSAGFVLSRSRNEKKEEDQLEEVVDMSPAKPIKRKESAAPTASQTKRKSILKKKFLDKSKPVEMFSPSLSRFDLQSPCESDNSWGKSRRKKGGFKTKKEKQAAEKSAKKTLRDAEKDKRAAKSKKICYKEPGSDTEAPSEFSTTTSISVQPPPRVIPSTDTTGIPFSFKTGVESAFSSARTREPSPVLETRVLQDITPADAPSPPSQEGLGGVIMTPPPEMMELHEMEVEGEGELEGMGEEDKENKVLSPQKDVKISPKQTNKQPPQTNKQSPETSPVTKQTSKPSEKTPPAALKSKNKARKSPKVLATPTEQTGTKRAAERGAAAAEELLKKLESPIEAVETSMLGAEEATSKRLCEKVYQRKRKRSKAEKRTPTLNDEEVNRNLDVVQEMLNFINSSTSLEVEVGKSCRSGVQVEPSARETSPLKEVWGRSRSTTVQMRPTAQVTEQEIVAQFRELTDCMEAGGVQLGEEIEDSATPPAADPFSYIVSRALGPPSPTPADPLQGEEHSSMDLVGSPVKHNSPLLGFGRSPTAVSPQFHPSSPTAASPQFHSSSPTNRYMVDSPALPALGPVEDMSPLVIPSPEEEAPITPSPPSDVPPIRAAGEFNLENCFQMICRSTSLPAVPESCSSTTGAFSWDTQPTQASTVLPSLLQNSKPKSLHSGPAVSLSKGKVENTLSRVEDTLRSVQRKEVEMFREMETQYSTIRQNNKNLTNLLGHLKTQIQPVQETDIEGTNPLPHLQTNVDMVRKEWERGFRDRQKLLMRKSADKQRRAMMNKLALFLMWQDQ